MIEVDLVYLWVNGNDPKWAAKRDACIGAPTRRQENCTARYADSGELKYSLRSVEKYAPWIRNIFIITDDQVPEWLDVTNPRICIVDHKDIMPAECLPCFNSTLLEHFVPHVPGLSEHFIYGNDDTYLNQPVTPSVFFADDQKPMIYMFRKPFRKYVLAAVSFIREKVLRKPMNLYVEIVRNAARLVEEKYGIYCACKPHHNFDAYLKSNILRTQGEFQDKIVAMYSHHKRYPDDVHRSLYNFAAIAEGTGHLRYVSRSHSFSLNIHRRKHYAEFEHCHPVFFCMNDTPRATDEDRTCSIAYLQKMFPEKSQFEK